MSWLTDKEMRLIIREFSGSRAGTDKHQIAEKLKMDLQSRKRGRAVIRRNNARNKSELQRK